MKWRMGILAGCLVLAVLAVLLFGITTEEGVTVGGLDLGGKNAFSCWMELNQAEDDLKQQKLVIRLRSEDMTLHPNVRFRKIKMVAAAFRQAQTPLEVRYDRKALTALLEDYAAAYDTAYIPSGYRLKGKFPNLSTREFDGVTQLLTLDPGTPARRLDKDAVFAAVDALYSNLFLRQNYQIVLDVPAQKEPEPLDLDAIYDKICRQPVNDSLDMETYAEVPGSYGYVFNLDNARAMLKDKPITLPMEAVEPEIMGQAVYFRDELGHCETKHTKDKNRNTNLRLMSQALDGLILQPGEEFSFNGSVGERTKAKGYMPAGAYSGTRLVQDTGGGVCQGSTTLYNCALLADLEIIERNCHGMTVNYVPIGLDAAVNWSTKTDLRFKNNWNFPMMICAEVSDGYLRMKILGTDEKDYYIKMTAGHSEEELRIYANSYKSKYDKETGELISKDLEARSSYMYMD